MCGSTWVRVRYRSDTQARGREVWFGYHLLSRTGSGVIACSGKDADPAEVRVLEGVPERACPYCVRIYATARVNDLATAR